MSDLNDRIDIANAQMKDDTKVFRMLTPLGGGSLGKGSRQPDVWQFLADRLGQEVAIYVTDRSLAETLAKRWNCGERAKKLVALTAKAMLPDMINPPYSRPAYFAGKLARELA